jgi:hypothetical protein
LQIDSPWWPCAGGTTRHWKRTGHPIRWHASASRTGEFSLRPATGATRMQQQLLLDWSGLRFYNWKASRRCRFADSGDDGGRARTVSTECHEGTEGIYRLPVVARERESIKVVFLSLPSFQRRWCRRAPAAPYLTPPDRVSPSPSALSFRADGSEADPCTVPKTGLEIGLPSIP